MEFQPWDNPMGTDGFEFVEYAAPDPKALGALFESIGLIDAVRSRGIEGYTYWDYQQLRFPRNEGMRIDFILGSAAFDDLWAKDLEQHLATIDGLVLASPVVQRDANPDERVWDLSQMRGQFSLAPLPSANSTT